MKPTEPDWKIDSSISHAFNVEHAQQYGVSEAILIANFQFWILKNMANQRHYYDKRTWTYNSAAAMCKQFPYWTAGQVRRVLQSLIRQGILVTGNFNRIGYDRTLWYAFKDEADFIGAPISRKRKIHLAKTKNGSDENDKPIPDTITNAVPDRDFLLDSEIERSKTRAEQIYDAYPLKKAKPDAIIAIKKALDKVPFQALLAKTTAFAAARSGNLDFCPNPATWFNQERYNDDPSTWRPRDSKGKPIREALKDEDYLRPGA